MNTRPIGFIAFSTFAALIFALADTAHATTYYYNGSGAPNTPASWTTLRAGGGTPAPDFTTAGNTFVVQNSQSPALNNNLTISGAGSGLLVETGGLMNVGSNLATLTLSMQGGASYAAAGGSYNGVTFGTVDAASTFTYSGAGTAVLNLTYGNFTWQSSGGSSSPNFTPLSVAGTLTLNQANELQLNDGDTNKAWNVGADVVIGSGAELNLQEKNGDSGNGTLNIGGGLANSGTIKRTSNNATGISTINFNGTGSSNATWGAVTTTNFNKVVISIASTKTIVFTDSLNEGAAAFNVNGTLNIGTNVLSGTSGTFTLASGASLITANATGLDGSFTVTGTKSFNTGANYEFQGAATGTTLPSTVNNLTINRSSGNVDLNGSGTTQTVSNTLNVFSGNLNANGTRTTVTVAGTGDAVVMRGGGQINSNATTSLTSGSGGNVVFDAVNNGTATIAGNLNLGGQTRQFNIGNGSAATDMSVSGVISNGALTKLGAGTLALSGNNSYTGNTTINAGTLQLAASGVIANGSAVSLANTSGANLDVNGQTETIASLSGGGASGGNVQLGSGTLTVGDTTSTTYAGVVSGTGGKLVKQGTGTLTLTGSNTYTGTTDVNAGNLRANNTTGSATGTGNVTVNADGTLSGTGSVAGSVTITGTAGHNGTLSPGASIESLSVGTTISDVLTFNANATFDYEINSSASANSYGQAADLVRDTGLLTINGGTLKLTDLASTSVALPLGTKFTLISYSGAWNNGTFTSRPDDSLVTIGANTFTLNYNDTSRGLNFISDALGTSFVTLSVTAVPEASVCLFGTFLCGVVGLVYRGRVLSRRAAMQAFDPVI